MTTLMTNTLRTLALGAALIASQAQAELYYFHNDHLGTPQVVTDTAGDVVWEGQYSPFGEVVETTSDVQQDLRFPGQLLDRETGLHYNYFRDFDPGTGRYLESDPIGLLGGLNSYAFVDNRPISELDPFGLARNMGKPPGINGNREDFIGSISDLIDSSICDWWPAHCLFKCVAWRCTIEDECGNERIWYIGSGENGHSPIGYDPNNDENCECTQEVLNPN